jgi:hypothetical protein
VLEYRVRPHAGEFGSVGRPDPIIPDSHQEEAMKSSWYATIDLAFIVAWPFALTDKISNLAVGILVVVSANALAFTWYQTSSARLSYFRGLDIVAASFMSGCANITFLYIVPVLALIQLLALCYSLAGLVAGRKFSQHRWILLVNSFYERRTGRPHPAFEALELE